MHRDPGEGRAEPSPLAKNDSRNPELYSCGDPWQELGLFKLNLFFRVSYSEALQGKVWGSQRCIQRCIG